MSPHPAVTHLLEHADWVRQLARQLVADPSQADDVAQQTFLQALRRPPRTTEAPRAWLARVVRNTATDRARNEASRRAREAAVARGDATSRTDPGGAVAERAAMHRDVVDAVMALSEPYREVVLLRYFEDLPPRRIARQTQTPIATVKTRLQRGLALLRERLDQQFGDRTTWCAALAPILHGVGRSSIALSPFALAGGLLMKWKTVTVVACAALTLSTLWWATRPPAAAGIPSPGNEVRAALDPVEMPQTQTQGEAQTVRTPATEPATTATSAWQLRGQAVAVGGISVSGIKLELRDPRLRQPLPLQTDDTGGFTVSYGTALDPMQLFAAQEDRAIYAAVPDHRADQPFVSLMIGPVGHVRGRVLDDKGAGLYGAEVSFSFTAEQLAEAERINEIDFSDIAPIQRHWTLLTDANGGFDFGVVPWTRSLRLAMRAEGFLATSVIVFPSKGPLAISLRPEPDPATATPSTVLRGTVVGPAGRLIAHATVRMGHLETATDALGQFELQTERAVDEPVIAYRRGYQLARRDDLAGLWQNDPEALRNLVLRLGPPTLAIRGRVVAGTGRPLAGFRVTVRDGEPIGGGRLAESELDRLNPKEGATTDADGRFEIGGLSQRQYQLRAYHPSTLAFLDSAPIDAGSEGVELRLEPDSVHAELNGVVVDQYGKAVAGAGLTLTMSNGTGVRLMREEAATDASGAFALRDVAKGGLLLGIHPTEDALIERREVVLDATQAPPLRIQVERRLGLRLRPTGSTTNRTFRILDAAGEALEFTCSHSRGYGRSKKEGLRGVDWLVTVAVSAQTLVVYDGTREEQRILLPRTTDRVHEVVIP